MGAACCAQADPCAVPDKSSWFVVIQDWKGDKGATSFGFWVAAGLMFLTAPEEYKKLGKKWEDKGFHQHYFLPKGGDGRVISLWETKTPKTKQEVEVFVNGPDGLGEGKVFDNMVMPLCSASKVPQSFFSNPKEPEVKMPKGAFYVSIFEMKKDAEIATFQKTLLESSMSQIAAAAAKGEFEKLGRGHFILYGGGAETCIFIYETEKDMGDSKEFPEGFANAEEFFMGGTKFLKHGASFKVADGNLTSPTPAFPK